MESRHNEFQQYVSDPCKPQSFQFSETIPTSNPAAALPGNAANGSGATPLLSSVHPQETSVEDDGDHSYRAFLISGQRPAVLAARQVYESIDQLEGKNRIELFDSCRTQAWFVRHAKTHQVRVASRRCHLRWCPICAGVRRRIITESVKKWLSERKRPKFVTFTLRHSDEALTAQIDRLYSAFRKLRHLYPIRQAFKGGIWFFQVKKSSNDGRWHPHFHCLVDGSYLAQRYLAELWLSVSGNSDIVDIRPVKDKKRQAEYVARYSASPCSLKSLDLYDRMELVLSVHGRRICGTWGTGKSIVLSPKTPEDSYQWEQIAQFGFCKRNRHGDVFLSGLWEAWKSRSSFDMATPWSTPPPDETNPVLQCEPEPNITPWLF